MLHRLHRLQLTHLSSGISRDDLVLLKQHLTKKLYALIQEYLKARRLLDEEYINHDRDISAIEDAYSKEVNRRDYCRDYFHDMKKFKDAWCLRRTEELNNKIRIEKQLWKDLCLEYNFLNTPVGPPVGPPAVLPDGWD